MEMKYTLNTGIKPIVIEEIAMIAEKYGVTTG